MLQGKLQLPVALQRWLESESNKNVPNRKPDAMLIKNDLISGIHREGGERLVFKKEKTGISRAATIRVIIEN